MSKKKCQYCCWLFYYFILISQHRQNSPLWKQILKIWSTRKQQEAVIKGESFDTGACLMLDWKEGCAVYSCLKTVPFFERAPLCTIHVFKKTVWTFEAIYCFPREVFGVCSHIKCGLWNTARSSVLKNQLILALFWGHFVLLFILMHHPTKWL